MKVAEKLVFKATFIRHFRSRFAIRLSGWALPKAGFRSQLIMKLYGNLIMMKANLYAFVAHPFLKRKAHRDANKNQINKEKW